MKRFESASSSRANPFGAIPFGLCLLVFAACSGSGGGSGGGSNANNGGDFAVLKTDPVNGATIFLNDAVNIDFAALHPGDWGRYAVRQLPARLTKPPCSTDKNAPRDR